MELDKDVCIFETIDIDGDPDPIKSLSENTYSISRRLVTNILKINNRYNFINRIAFDRIYVPHTILNIISDAPGFTFKAYTDEVESSPVGIIGYDLNVYISHSMPRDQIRFSFDSDLIRDNRLSVILEDDFDHRLKEVILEIKSEFLY